MEVAKSAEDNVAVPEETAPEETEQKTTAQEIAPIVEQLETAEDAIEAAKDVEGDISLVESLVQNEDGDSKDIVEPVYESDTLDFEPDEQSVIELHQRHQLDSTASDGAGPADSSDVQENEN